MSARRVRIGIDTGGTFTDVVAVDEESGQTTTTKTPSTPADPAEGFLNGVRKVLGLMDLDGSAVTAVSHGTTVATNQLLEGKLDRIGFITTEGYESVLEIARQSVPDGYGNSYFWVKPPRIVPADLVQTVRGRLDHHRRRGPPLRRGRRPRGRPLLQGRRHHHRRRLLPARLRERRARAPHARGDPRPSTPAASSRIVQRGAARVPRVRALGHHAGRRRGEAQGRARTSPTSAPGSTRSPPACPSTS